MSQPPASPPNWGTPPPQPPQPPASPRRKRRVFMWVIIAVNALFAWWLISFTGQVSTSGTCDGLAGAEADACQTGEDFGYAIGLVLIVLLWALIDVILYVLYRVTRRR